MRYACRYAQSHARYAPRRLLFITDAVADTLLPAAPRLDVPLIIHSPTTIATITPDHHHHAGCPHSSALIHFYACLSLRCFFLLLIARSCHIRAMPASCCFTFFPDYRLSSPHAMPLLLVFPRHVDAILIFFFRYAVRPYHTLMSAPCRAPVHMPCLLLVTIDALRVIKSAQRFRVIA